MYGEYEPVIVYGVIESDEARVISPAFLKRYEVDRYPTGVVCLYACNYAYGVCVAPEEFRSGKCADPKKEEYVRKFVEALKKRDVDLGEPGFHLALMNGDHGCEQRKYLDGSE